MAKKLAAKVRDKRMGEQEQYAAGKRIPGDGMFECRIEVEEEDTATGEVRVVETATFAYVLDYRAVDTAEIQRALDEKKAALVQRAANRSAINLDLIQ